MTNTNCISALSAIVALSSILLLPLSTSAQPTGCGIPGDCSQLPNPTPPCPPGYSPTCFQDCPYCLKNDPECPLPTNKEELEDALDDPIIGIPGRDGPCWIPIDEDSSFSCEVCTPACWFTADATVCSDAVQQQIVVRATARSCVETCDPVTVFWDSCVTTGDVAITGTTLSADNNEACFTVQGTGLFSVTPRQPQSCPSRYVVEKPVLVSSEYCDGDVNVDGAINIDDIVTVQLNWGPCPTDFCTSCCRGDADGSGTVDVDDIVYVVLRFGASCP